MIFIILFLSRWGRRLDRSRRKATLSPSLSSLQCSIPLRNKWNPLQLLLLQYIYAIYIQTLIPVMFIYIRLHWFSFSKSNRNKVGKFVNHFCPIFWVSSGTAWNRSATRPMSATWKMGASGSLLIATIVLESFIPARCWMAPEMPTAMYNSGARIFPVCPT